MLPLASWPVSLFARSPVFNWLTGEPANWQTYFSSIDQIHDAFGIARVHQRAVAQMALALAVFLGQNVALARVTAHQLAGGGNFEPLFGRAMAFHFRHCNFLTFYIIYILRHG